MSGVYTVPFAYTGNANVDLVEVTAASSKPIIILGWDIGQSSDFGDAQEEILTLSLKSGQTTSGSGGSAVTPVNTDSSGIAASFVAEQANTTKASAGTILTHGVWTWNVRMPGDKLLSPEQQFVMAASRRATLEISGAADSLTITGLLWVQEIG
jgi:hypothetical protein